MTSNFWRSVWTFVKVKSKKYFYFTDFFAKIYFLLTQLRKTPPLRSHYYLPTTSRNPLSLLMGSVLTWHIYQPRSDSWILLIWSRQILWSCFEFMRSNNESECANPDFFFSRKPFVVYLHLRNKHVGKVEIF